MQGRVKQTYPRGARIKEKPAAKCEECGMNKCGPGRCEVCNYNNNNKIFI